MGVQPALRPAAVIVPPFVTALGVLGLVVGLNALLAEACGTTCLARVGVLEVVLLGVSCLVHAAARRVDSRVIRYVLAPLVCLVVGGLLDGLLPAPALHVVAVASAALAASMAPPLWRLWRERWLRARTTSVSLLAPSEWAAYEALRRLERVPWLDIRSVIVPNVDAKFASRILGHVVVGAARSDVRLERHVVVSCPTKDTEVGRTIAQLVSQGHQITSESLTLRGAEGRVDSRQADPLNLVMSRPKSTLGEVVTRTFDLTLSTVLFLATLPIGLFVALAIRLDSKGPIFYRQQRMGRGGKPFNVLKFRSMRVDAEKSTGPVWASENDPRVTRVGRVLRKFRLDELPQFWNVLRGEMALVGPRPERPHFAEHLRQNVPLFDLRTIVRPGITGWAQVRLAYGASHDDARAKLECDLYYVVNRSLWFDLAILAETARVVLTGQGAR